MAQFDTNYYNNHLHPLFGENNVYNVDPLLFKFHQDDYQTSTLINSSAFFKDIVQISFSSDDKSQVNQRMNEDIAAFNASSTQPVSSSTITDSFKPLSGFATDEYVNANIQRGSDTSVNTLLKAIQDSVGNPTDVNKSHDAMHIYMRNIVSSVCLHYFKSALSAMSQDPTFSNGREPWQESRYLLNTLPNNNQLVLNETLKETANAVLCEIIKTKVKQNMDLNENSTSTNKKMLPQTFIEDLRYGNFKGPLYYKLRTELAQRIKLDNVIKVGSPTTIQYFKMLAADLYIKTCYPILIFDYIQCMMTLYMQYGDFMNARLALLGKVLYVYQFITYLVEMFSALNTSPSDPYKTLLTTIVSNLQFYLQNLNKIDMTGNGDANKLRSIIQDLHNVSSEVVDKNSQVHKTKNEIIQNQLAMRNIIYNTEQLRKQYTNKMLEFIFFLCLLILIIVVCSVMLALATPTNNFALYVMYISTGIAMAVLIYLAIKIISKLIADGKKSS
jgi:hypothetical protein